MSDNPKSGSYTPEPSDRDTTQHYSEGERALMLRLAREAVSHAALHGTQIELPADGLPGVLLEKRACFVTLFKSGELRGCIGHLLPRHPLYAAIAESAFGAAMRDPRFPALEPGELPAVRIELSVLSEPRELAASSPAEVLARLVPGRHGVIIRSDGRTSTFLPQVWEHFPDKEKFMEQLSLKASRPADAWRRPGTEILVYESDSFEEPADLLPTSEISEPGH